MNATRLLAASSTLLITASATFAADPSPAPPVPPPMAPVAGAPEDLSRYKTADELWTHVQEMMHASRGNGPDAAATHFADLRSAFNEFVKRFPEDARVWQARSTGAQISAILFQLNRPGFTAERALAELQAISADPAAPADVKRMSRMGALPLLMKSAPVETIEKEVDAFQRDYPEIALPVSFKSTLADKLQASNPAKAQKLLDEVQKMKDEAAAQQAAATAKMQGLLNKPVDVKFTALDGSQIDLSKMNGKVVLLDFWATWCGPCMQEVPHVVETYKKYHDQGFEIVGISLDEDKDAVLKTTKEKEMSWPQFFDGKGWQNEISTKYGITSIPQMWLVNKKGLLVNMEARADLNGAVEKLLAE